MLIFQVLRTAHDDLGHNGFPRTYAAIKRVFFWKGMKEDIRKHCKTCATCQLHKLENVKFKRKIFKPSLQPMDFICMDLIGEFHPPTSRGHHYALTAVCMLTGFTWCVPLKTKTAEEVPKAYVVRRRGHLAPCQPLSVCALLPAYERIRHLRPPGNLGHRLRRPRWID